MKALTAAEMQQVDRLTTERFGMPSHQLMESAGKSVAEVFLEQYGLVMPDAPARVAVLCGKGNNGGDGFVVARYLKDEADHVRVYLFAKPDELRGDAAKNFERWCEFGEVTLIGSAEDWDKAWAEISTAEVIVDALLGTGIRGAATGLIAQAIDDTNRLSHDATAARPAWIVAVDTPSGLPSDGEAPTGPVMKAHWTVTFTAPKVGQLISPQAGCCGQLVVREIGSPAALIEEIGKGSLRWAGADEFAGLPLIRSADSHKGTYGHVLVVAGSLGKSGAAVMAGYAAMRTGAGLVTVATPDVVLPVVASAHPEFMTEPLLSTEAGTASTRNLASPPAVAQGQFASPIGPDLRGVASSGSTFERVFTGKTVLAIGPGMGEHPETQSFMRSVVQTCSRPVILDADGLNAFVGHADKLADRNSKYLVITPHPGEMSRLLGVSTNQVQAGRVQTAVDAAKKWNACVVLKGYHTVIASPDGKVLINTTGNAGLAKGGSGDVLTGLLAGLVAQFGASDLLRVVALGVYLHGRAADLLAEQSDASGILAGEVANTIPFARRKLLQELQERD
jgi:ADP-dependent NAD(P)H-hydrate dehydratase / NAD(P)H-hydrate epimerase